MAERATALTILQPSVGTLDPHAWTDAADRLNIRHAVYEPLMRPDERGGHRPMLAESWQTSDGRSWAFALRSGVRFHNGHPLGAADVVAALDRARNPGMSGELGTSGLFGTYLDGASFEPAGADVVRLVLPYPMADLLDVLADISIILDLHDGGWPCGTGPYRITSSGPNGLVMEAASEYWAGTVPFERLTWQAEKDPQARLRALLAGDVDVATSLPPNARSLASVQAQVSAQELPTSACVIFMCNAAAGPCADRRVRQALNYAVDVPAIISEIRRGSARPLTGPLTPLSLGYDPATPRYPHDVEMARALLRDAGHGNHLELNLCVPASTPDEAPAIAAIVARQYEQAGIGLTFRVIDDRPAYASMVRAKQIRDLACFDSTPVSTYRVLREKFHAGVAGPWWQGYRNAAVDRAVDEAAATTDRRRRRDRYRQAYRVLRDDPPWVFLYSPTTWIGWGIRASGVSVQPQGALQFAPAGA